MSGYWPSSFFACLWTEAELKSINSFSFSNFTFGFHAFRQEKLKMIQ